MPAKTQTAVAEAEPESQPDLSPDEPRTFGTPINEIFAKLMPYEEELEAQKGEKPEVEPKKEPELEKKPEPKTVEVDLPKVDLPGELFGQPKEKEIPSAEGEPVKEEPPKELKGEARKNFQRLADEKYELAKSKRELERKVKEYESKPAVDPALQARLEQAEAELKQYQERIYAADLTLDPKFEAQYKIPREKNLERAMEAYAEAGGDPKDIEAALASNGRARSEKLDEIYGAITNKYLLGKVEKAIGTVEDIDAQIATVMQNRETWLKQTQQERQANQHKYYEQLETTIKGNLDYAEKYLAEQGWEVYRRTDDPNFKWWNDQASKLRQAAEHVMLKVDDPKQMAIASALIPAAPIYREMFLKQKERADKAEALLKEYKQSDAGLGGESTGNGSEVGDDNMSYAEAVLKRVHQSTRNR